MAKSLETVLNGGNYVDGEILVYSGHHKGKKPSVSRSPMWTLRDIAEEYGLKVSSLPKIIKEEGAPIEVRFRGKGVKYYVKSEVIAFMKSRAEKPKGNRRIT